MMKSKKNRNKFKLKPNVACHPVEKIIGFYTGKEKRRYYRVQWAPSWVPEENLLGCENLIEQFFVEENIINKDSILNNKCEITKFQLKIEDEKEKEEISNDELKPISINDEIPILIENDDNFAEINYVEIKIKEKGNRNETEKKKADTCLEVDVSQGDDDSNALKIKEEEKGQNNLKSCQSSLKIYPRQGSRAMMGITSPVDRKAHPKETPTSPPKSNENSFRQLKNTRIEFEIRNRIRDLKGNNWQKYCTPLHPKMESSKTEFVDNRKSKTYETRQRMRGVMDDSGSDSDAPLSSLVKKRRSVARKSLSPRQMIHIKDELLEMKNKDNNYVMSNDGGNVSVKNDVNVKSEVDNNNSNNNHNDKNTNDNDDNVYSVNDDHNDIGNNIDDKNNLKGILIENGNENKNNSNDTDRYPTTLGISTDVSSNPIPVVAPIDGLPPIPFLLPKRGRGRPRKIVPTDDFIQRTTRPTSDRLCKRNGYSVVNSNNSESQNGISEDTKDFVILKNEMAKTVEPVKTVEPAKTVKPVKTVNPVKTVGDVHNNTAYRGRGRPRRSDGYRTKSVFRMKSRCKLIYDEQQIIKVKYESPNDIRETSEENCKIKEEPLSSPPPVMSCSSFSTRVGEHTKLSDKFVETINEPVSSIELSTVPTKVLKNSPCDTKKIIGFPSKNTNVKSGTLNALSNAIGYQVITSEESYFYDSSFLPKSKSLKLLESCENMKNEQEMTTANNYNNLRADDKTRKGIESDDESLSDDSDSSDVEKSFECDVCEERFHTSVLLHRHRFIHCENHPFSFTKRKPIRCKIPRDVQVIRYKAKKIKGINIQGKKISTDKVKKFKERSFKVRKNKDNNCKTGKVEDGSCKMGKIRKLKDGTCKMGKIRKLKDDNCKAIKIKDGGSKTIKIKSDGSKTIKIKSDGSKTIKIKSDGSKTIKIKPEDSKTIKINDNMSKDIKIKDEMEDNNHEADKIKDNYRKSRKIKDGNYKGRKIKDDNGNVETVKEDICKPKKVKLSNPKSSLYPRELRHRDLIILE